MAAGVPLRQLTTSGVLDSLRLSELDENNPSYIKIVDQSFQGTLGLAHKRFHLVRKLGNSILDLGT